MARRDHLILLSLAIVFGLPFISSWLLVWNPDWLPENRANRGRLITPPVATPMTGAWTLLVPDADGCAAPCERVRTVASVVRRALGPQGRHVVGPADCKALEAQALCTKVLVSAGGGTTLVIIDPMGNAMMSYDAEVTPRDLLKDMQRLVKASRNWRFDGNQ